MSLLTHQATHRKSGTSDRLEGPEPEAKREPAPAPGPEVKQAPAKGGLIAKVRGKS